MKPRFLLFAIAISFAACNNNQSSSSSSTEDSTMKETAQPPQLKEEAVNYSANGVNMVGYIAYDSSKAGKLPGILVVPEWWGLNDYPKMRARKLAELGYFAMAVDMYGDGKVADNPTDAGKMAGQFSKNLQMTKDRFDAALQKLKTYDRVDSDNIAAIGYCFGGGVVLNVARMGENLNGVVSFHGELLGAPAKKNLLKAKILVCQGGNDQFTLKSVPEFKKQMDSIGADYTFKEYPNATHAFTNPGATATGEKFNIPIRYNTAADTASWNDMKDFFGKIFK